MIPKLLAVALLLALDPPPSPLPDPGLTPGQVVEIQLEALQKNDVPAPDAGIATTFRFASPGNRKVTGPLERFATIVRSPGYKPMIGHRIAGYGPTKVAGDLAARRVTVVAADGQAYEYEFRLSKDPESGCWFTDGVVPVLERPPVDEGKVARSSYFIPPSRLEPLLHLPDLV